MVRLAKILIGCYAGAMIYTFSILGCYMKALDHSMDALSYKLKAERYMRRTYGLGDDELAESYKEKAEKWHARYMTLAELHETKSEKWSKIAKTLDPFN